MTSNQAIVFFIPEGYRITDDGLLVSPSGKIRSVHVRKDGYAQISFRIDGKTHHAMVHRLCAYQKYGEIVFQAECVRHLDGDKTNNKPDNIEIGTFSDNAMDVPCEVRIEKARHASSFSKGFRCEETVMDIRKYHETHKSYKQTMRRFGISSKGTLSYILRNR